MKNPASRTLTLNEEEMRTYGYKVIDHLVNHFQNQALKNPVALASREEMEALFLEAVPLEPSSANEVLEHVIENVMSNSSIISHPKAYSFVPGPSNFISTMADVLATGFNVFSGGWVASPAAAELENCYIELAAGNL